MASSSSAPGSLSSSPKHRKASKRPAEDEAPVPKARPQPPPRPPPPVFLGPPPPKPIELSTLSGAIIHKGMMKYVTLKVYNDHNKEESKIIVRGLRPSEWTRDQNNTIDAFDDGHRETEKELESIGVYFYDVLGYGLMYHDPDDKSVNIYEEQEDVPEKFEGNSEQCLRARQIVDGGKFRPGYTAYHVLKKGQLSPRSAHKYSEMSRILDVEAPQVPFRPHMNE